MLGIGYRIFKSSWALNKIAEIEKRADGRGESGYLSE